MKKNDLPCLLAIFSSLQLPSIVVPVYNRIDNGNYVQYVLYACELMETKMMVALSYLHSVSWPLYSDHIRAWTLDEPVTSVTLGFYI